MKISAEYAAGFFDGEGCITLGTKNNWWAGEFRGQTVYLRLMVGNTYFPICEDFRETFGGSVHVQQRSRKDGRNWKDFCNWRCSGDDAFAFLQLVKPHIRVKKAQVEVALEFMTWRAQGMEKRNDRVVRGHGSWIRKPETILKEAEFLDRMRELNHRGVKPFVPTALQMAHATLGDPEN